MQTVGHIRPLRLTDIPAVRVFNSLVFPVSYGDSFYADLERLECPCFVLYHGRILVGAICCCRHQNFTSAGFSLYITTLGVLEGFRRRGVARSLAKALIGAASRNSLCTTIKLHVQVSNTAAQRLYLSLGFRQRELVPDYYTRVYPRDAFLFELELRFEANDA